MEVNVIYTAYHSFSYFALNRGIRTYTKHLTLDGTSAILARLKQIIDTTTQELDFKTKITISLWFIISRDIIFL